MKTIVVSGHRVVGETVTDIDAVAALEDIGLAAYLPFEDFDRYGVILALKRNGEYMPVSDKGPLFIVYPYDSDPALRSTTYTSRSAWQVSQLVVK